MNVINLQQAEREAQRVQANHEELIERIGRAIREDGAIQPLAGLHLARCSSLPLKPVHLESRQPQREHCIRGSLLCS